jgi:hypothetical protein
MMQQIEIERKEF